MTERTGSNVWIIETFHGAASGQHWARPGALIPIQQPLPIMGLEDIAAQTPPTTHHQRQRGVPAIDDTDSSIADRLEEYADELPCAPDQATTLLETHVTGTTIEASADAADVTTVTAVKTLHRLGVDGLSPLTPTAHDILRDWIAGDLPRSDAETLANASHTEFALAAYIETHDPIPGASEITERLQTPDGDAMVEKHDLLAETMTDATDLA